MRRKRKKQKPKYGPADFTEFLRRVASGRSVRSVCTDPDMPRRQTVACEAQRNKKFRERYTKVWERVPIALQLRSKRRSKRLIARVRALKFLSERQKASILGISTMSASRIGRGVGQ